MIKRFQIDDDGDISEFDSNGKWVDCWMYANGKHWEGLCNELNQLSDENEELKQRNTNQYNQLTGLWQIIEEENWEKLIAMKKQLKEDEERVQQEWKCYE